MGVMLTYEQHCGGFLKAIQFSFPYPSFNKTLQTMRTYQEQSVVPSLPPTLLIICFFLSLGLLLIIGPSPPIPEANAYFIFPI